MYVVVMIEPGPKLSASEQINEVFGPFEFEEGADLWVARMLECYPPGSRQFLIQELSHPNIVNHLHPSGS